MSATDKLFAGSIPEIYERYLVPLIFQPYADDLAGRIAALKPMKVLETAAGTGVVTRAMARALPPSVEIVATDLNQAMLDRAASISGAVGPIVWRQVDALKLPFADQSFDVVTCQFGVMFFPDKIQGFREARRVLKPGGHFLFNVWNEIAKNPVAETITQALAEIFPKDPPRFLARTPHGYHDADKIREELAAAGFSTVAIDTLDRVSRANSARDPATGFCQGTPLRSEIEARDPARLEEATRVAAHALAKKFGTGAIEVCISAHVVTAR